MKPVTVTIKISDPEQIELYNQFLELRLKTKRSKSANDFGKQMFAACFSSNVNKPICITSIEEMKAEIEKSNTENKIENLQDENISSSATINGNNDNAKQEPGTEKIPDWMQQ